MRSLPNWGYPLLGVATALGLAELLPRLGVVPRSQFPPASEVLAKLGEEAVTGEFWAALGETLQGWAVGLGVAIALAVPIGMLIGRAWLLDRALRGVVEFLRPIPAVALIPLAILIYGRGLEMKTFLIAFAAFWPLLVHAIYGARDADPLALDSARTYGLGGFARFVRITLPSAAPYVATGVRIASAVALILAVTAELVVGAPGLGHEIRLAQDGGAVTLTYAYIMATGLLGWGLNSILAWIERRVLYWHPSYRMEPASDARR